MSLVRLLSTLKPLLEDPAKNFDQIVLLLETHEALAEFEVARFWVADRLGGETAEQIRDRDPKVRKRAIRVIGLVFPRSEAAKLLRRVMKDPDWGVRAHARRVVRKLALSDVGLPDTRVQLNPNAPIRPTTIGAWNPTGWAFGTMMGWRILPARSHLLAQHGLPAIEEASQLAALLGLEEEELTAFARPGTKRGAPYVEFEIDKASGGKRQITAPKHRLKQAQRTILEQILGKVPPHPAAHGFVAGRSIVTNATPHQRARVVIKMDLIDFFPTVHYRRVIGVFHSIGYDYTVAAELAKLTTHRPVLEDGRVVWPGVLPQGAPTSPAITNLLCRRLDSRLAGLAAKSGAVYTRYADDLTFSFANEPAVKIGKFCWWVDQICQQEGFAENAKKRRVLRPGNQQRVTGVVVNQGLSIPREARRRFRAILHNVRTHGLEKEARGRTDFIGYLRGFAAYVRMVQPKLGESLAREVEEVLGGG